MSSNIPSNKLSAINQDFGRGTQFGRSRPEIKHCSASDTVVNTSANKKSTITSEAITTKPAPDAKIEHVTSGTAPVGTLYKANRSGRPGETRSDRVKKNKNLETRFIQNRVNALFSEIFSDAGSTSGIQQSDEIGKEQYASAEQILSRLRDPQDKDAITKFRELVPRMAAFLSRMAPTLKKLGLPNYVNLEKGQLSHKESWRYMSVALGKLHDDILKKVTLARRFVNQKIHEDMKTGPLLRTAPKDVEPLEDSAANPAPLSVQPTSTAAAGETMHENDISSKEPITVDFSFDYVTQRDEKSEDLVTLLYGMEREKQIEMHVKLYELFNADVIKRDEQDEEVIDLVKLNEYLASKLSAEPPNEIQVFKKPVATAKGDSTAALFNDVIRSLKKQSVAKALLSIESAPYFYLFESDNSAGYTITDASHAPVALNYPEAHTSKPKSGASVLSASIQPKVKEKLRSNFPVDGPPQPILDAQEEIHVLIIEKSDMRDVSDNNFEGKPEQTSGPQSSAINDAQVERQLQKYQALVLNGIEGLVELNTLIPNDKTPSLKMDAAQFQEKVNKHVASIGKTSALEFAQAYMAELGQIWTERTRNLQKLSDELKEEVRKLHKNLNSNHKRIWDSFQDSFQAPTVDPVPARDEPISNAAENPTDSASTDPNSKQSDPNGSLFQN